jgi:phosphatidylserine/phosphatidylglycerophosphate/cardiolipin synthase-like enzyme
MHKTLLFITFLLLAQLAEAQFFIFGELQQSDITSTSFRLQYTTNNSATTLIQYGETDALELGAVTNSQNTSNHDIVLTGLSPATIYYVRACVINNGDTVESTVKNVFATASNSTGDIRVFFNKSVDTDVSNGTFPDITNSGAAIQAELIKRIDSAQTSIDVSAYNINVNAIVDALKAAHTRGVRVRYVANDGTANFALNPAPNFPVIYVNPDFLMHNKFLVFDANSVNDSYVWTGSMNLTSNNINTDFNNVVLIQDQTLAKTYVKEFEEMWGSNTATANLSNSRVGSAKLDNTPHKFMIGGKYVECYFSPSDNVTNKIEAALLSAGGDLAFATLSFTNDDLGAAVLNRHNSGETVAGIINNIGDLGTEYTPLTAAGVDVLADNHSADIHHKYAVVDANTPNSDPLVITGSHNWSDNAEQNNDENTLIIHDAEIANWYLQEFSKRYCEIVGTANCEYDPVVGTWEAEASALELKMFPNPASGWVNLEIRNDGTWEQLELAVYNSLGQLMENTVLRLDAGQTQLSLETKDWPAGSYFVRLSSEGKPLAAQQLMLR